MNLDGVKCYVYFYPLALLGVSQEPRLLEVPNAVYIFKGIVPQNSTVISEERACRYEHFAADCMRIG